MTRQTRLIGLFLVLLSLVAQAQTDPEGREHALQLYQAYEVGEQMQSFEQFERLFMGRPELTKRAFVSAVEYMTEVYETDPVELEDTVEFAFDIAVLIEQQFADPLPKQLLVRMMNGDQRVARDLVNYAAQLYPAYAEELPLESGPASPQYPSGFEQPRTKPNGPFRPADAVGGPPKSKTTNGEKSF